MNKGKFSMKVFLNEASKAEITGKPIATPSGFDIINIPYEKIKPSEKNKYGLRDIEELAAVIDEVGLLHNLVVAEPDEDGFYELLSGGRRYEALGLLKWATVPCKVEKRESEAIDELKLIFANSTARIISDYEKTIQAQRIKELMQQMKADGHKFKGRMRDIVANILKVSSSQVGRMESINKNLSPDFKAAFERGEIGITDAYNASLLDTEEQAAIFAEFEETGKVDTKKPKEEQPPKPAADRKKPAKVDRDGENKRKKVYTWLLDAGGTEYYKASGSLAVIAAVDGEDFSGYFSTGEAGTVDFIMLATAIVGECVGRLPDSDSKEALKSNIAALFENELKM